MSWQVAVGGLIGLAMGYGGARLAPRWMEKAPRSWEVYTAAAVNGLLAALLAWQQPLTGYFWQHLVFISVLVTASLVDFHDRIIPNELVLFGLGAGLLLQLAAPYEAKNWWEALSGAGLGFGFLFLLAILVKGGMGFGDVKLAAVIGLFLGYPWVGMGMIFSFLAGGFVGLVLILTRLVGRKDYIPFGPYLALGSIITVLYGEAIWHWYMGM